MTNISARIEEGDPLPGESTPEHYVVVDLDFVPGSPDKVVSVLVQRSLVFGDTVNIEIDGDLSEGFPSMRIHMNDGLIYDTNFAHGGYGVQLTDQRETPEHPEPMDDIVQRLLAGTTSTTSELIDDQVRDDAAEIGANVNNGGIETQVRFLLEQGHSEDAVADWLGA